MKALRLRGYDRGVISATRVRSRQPEAGMVVALYDPARRAIVGSGRIASVHVLRSSWGVRGIVLDSCAPTTERCPACWGGERCPGYHGTDDEPTPCWGRIPCRICEGAGKCDPILARAGRSQLWEWAA